MKNGTGAVLSGAIQVKLLIIGVPIELAFFGYLSLFVLIIYEAPEVGVTIT